MRQDVRGEDEQAVRGREDRQAHPLKREAYILDGVTRTIRGGGRRGSKPVEEQGSATGTGPEAAEGN